MSAKIAGHFSFACEEKNEAKDRTPKDECHGQQKSSSCSKGWKQISRRRPSSPAGDSQSRQEGDEMEKVDTFFYEAGLQTKHTKKASWQKSLKECQKRQDELVQQTSGIAGHKPKGQRNNV